MGIASLSKLDTLPHSRHPGSLALTVSPHHLLQCSLSLVCSGCIVDVST